jgi:chromosome segregation ATPase
LPENISNESNSFYLDISNSDQTKDFQRWALQLNLEAQKNRELIQNLQKQLEERTTWALNLDNQLEERTAWALNLDNRIKAQDDSIATLQKEIQERTAWALNLDNRIKAQDDLIATLQKELDDRSKWALSLESEISRIRRRLSSSFVYRVLSKLRVLPNPWDK